MIVVESDRPHDCLRVCLASVFEVELDAIPFVDVELDWPGAWAAAFEWALDRGWFLSWVELGGDATLQAFVDEWGPVRFVWIASVTHESWGELAHAIVLRGPDVELFPPTGKREPSVDELGLAGVLTFVPLDPARFELRP